MLTAEQSHALQKIALRHEPDSVRVHEGYEDGAVSMTVRSGLEYMVDRWGGGSDTPLPAYSHTVGWNIYGLGAV